MKNIIILLLIALSTSAFAKGTRLKSFCGFEYGSLNDRLSCEQKERPLPKPFMQFKTANLIYGVRTKKLNTITLEGDYPVGTPLSKVKNDASTLMDMLTEKYGARFTHMTIKENDTVVLNYNTCSWSDTVIDIAIFKLGPTYMLNVIARDKVLQEEENEGSFIKQKQGYDVL